MNNSSGGFQAVELPGEFGFARPQVDHAKLHRPAHLLGGEAYAAGRVHGGYHLVGEFPQTGVKDGDFLAFFPQNGFVVLNNWKGHRSQGKYSRELWVRPGAPAIQ